MTPRHHLDPSTVLAHAAGALPPEMAAVADAHLEVSAHCRAQLERGERIGGALLDQQQPRTEDGDGSLRRFMLARVQAAIAGGDDAGAAIVVAARPVPQVPAPDPDRLPAALHPFFGASLRAVQWRWLAPGTHIVRAAGLPHLFMLRIAPGRAMPLHSHRRNELTQILQGAYHDHLGQFCAGDMADLDGQTEHQPVTSPGVPCICVSALDAPLRFRGRVARMLQPLFKL